MIITFRIKDLLYGNNEEYMTDLKSCATITDTIVTLDSKSPCYSSIVQKWGGKYKPTTPVATKRVMMSGVIPVTVRRVGGCNGCGKEVVTKPIETFHAE